MLVNDKRQLLCSFSNTVDFKGVIDKLYKFYNIYNNCVFVFYNTKNTKEVFITYNIINTENNFEKFPNTISIHRKKQSNTLYSLNAMNQIIRDENGGVFDKTFKVNWDYYRDSLIISGDVFIRIIPIKIYDIIS